MRVRGLTDLTGEPVNLNKDELLLDDFYPFRDAIDESLAQLEKQAEANTVKDTLNRVSKAHDGTDKKETE